MKLTSPDRAALRALVTRPPTPTDLKRSLGVETATRRWLVGAVMPLWLGAGLADWYRHKQTHIENTAGARESMIHSLMMTEAGIPVTLGLFCEVNPGVLAVCATALAAHGLTAYWDVSYAEQRRRVTPVEQHIHSVLEMTPVMATGFLAALYWDQVGDAALPAPQADHPGSAAAGRTERGPFGPPPALTRSLRPNERGFTLSPGQWRGAPASAGRDRSRRIPGLCLLLPRAAIVPIHFAASKPGPSGLAGRCGHQRDVPATRRVLAVGRAVERAQREIERLVERLQVVQDDSLSQRPRAYVDGADVQGLHAGPGGYRPGDDLPAAGT
jgi:hypothetical protein